MIVAVAASTAAPFVAVAVAVGGVLWLRHQPADADADATTTSPRAAARFDLWFLRQFLAGPRPARRRRRRRRVAGAGAAAAVAAARRRRSLVPCFFVDDAVDPHRPSATTTPPPPRPRSAADDGALGIARCARAVPFAVAYVRHRQRQLGAAPGPPVLHIPGALLLRQQGGGRSLVSLAACYLSCDALGRASAALLLTAPTATRLARPRVRRAPRGRVGARRRDGRHGLARALPQIALIAAARGALDRSSMATLESLLLPTSLAGASAGAAQVAAAVLVRGYPPAAKRARRRRSAARSARSRRGRRSSSSCSTRSSRSSTWTRTRRSSTTSSNTAPPTQHHSGVARPACFGVTFGLGAASCLSALVFAVPCLLRDERSRPRPRGQPAPPGRSGARADAAA